MTTHPKLPPLPECWTELDAKVRGEWAHQVLFTADQLRSYGLQCWKAGAAWQREQDAKIAEKHFIPGHSVAGPSFAAQCAAAIRNQPQQGEGQP